MKGLTSQFADLKALIVPRIWLLGPLAEAVSRNETLGAPERYAILLVLWLIIFSVQIIPGVCASNDKSRSPDHIMIRVYPFVFSGRKAASLDQIPPGTFDF